jgi:argininosuccinate synthase
VTLATHSFPKIQRTYNGFWFSAERGALQAIVTEKQRDVTSVVRLKLYKGNIVAAGRKSAKSPYDAKIATMEGDASGYDQGDSTRIHPVECLAPKNPRRVKVKT